MCGKKNRPDCYVRAGCHDFSSVSGEADEVDDSDGAAVETDTVATSAPSTLPPGLLCPGGLGVISRRL